MSDIKSCHMSDEELNALLAEDERKPRYEPLPERVKITGSPNGNQSRGMPGHRGRRTRKHNSHRVAA
jgi:hypothetical protein